MRRKQGRRDEQKSYDLADVNEQEQAKDGYEERESAFESDKAPKESQNTKQEQESAARIDSKKDEDMPFEKAELERAEPNALPPATDRVFSKFEETDKRVSGTKKEKKRKRGASGAPYVALIVLCFLGAAALVMKK